MTPIFFSTFMYSACKVTGWGGKELLDYEMRGGVLSLDASSMPGFRTLGQACRVAECEVYVDGSTYITRARCLAAGHFLRKAGSRCDVWVTCDDDVYADAAVVAQLVDVARATRGMVALPYLNRDGGSMTFRRVSGPTEWPAGFPVRRVDRVGMGLVAMHRDFVRVLDRVVPHFEDNVPAMFLEGVQDVGADGLGTWVGEDYWLCSLAENADLPMHVLLDAPGEHMGLRAKLDVDGVICLDSEENARKLAEGIDAKNAARAAHAEPSTRNDLPRVD
jgi:hypothetical protein